MNGTKRMVAIVATAFASSLLMGDGALSDEETKRKIADFVTLPSRLCGRALVDFRSELRGRKLTNRSWFDGDTNRLARLIMELAQTNDMKVASMMIGALGEYGTCAQLPFLYSCATNPILGKIAVEAVLRIEGVTSNSLEIVHGYLFQTNQFLFANIGDRTYLCHDLVSKVFSDSSLNSYRSQVLEMALDFEANVNITPNLVDMAIVSADPGYRHSKRRLAVLRAAKQRLDYDAQLIVPSNYEVERRIDVYNFQTNYLVNAINELVAYPEVNLPD